MIVIKRGNKKNEFEVYKKENEEVKKIQSYFGGDIERLQIKEVQRRSYF